MSYTNVFTGSTIYPTEVALTKLDMTANVILYWPVEAPLGVPLASARTPNLTAGVRPSA